MNNQKALWEKLAMVNSKFYIASSLGRNATEEEFRKSGEDDYNRLLTYDNSGYVKGVFLEIGAGTGRMTEFIARDWSKVIAVDISAEMIRQGKERLKHLKNIKWVENDGEKLPLEDNSVDFAFSYLVYQHVKTYRMVREGFREVCRVLKPNGIFLAFLRHEAEYVGKWSSGVTYDKDNIPTLLKGFKLLKSDYTDNCYTFWLYLQKHEEQK